MTSIDRGVEVRSISLFLLGGVTESIGEPHSARDEVVIVGIGPVISLLIGAVFGLSLFVLPDFSVAELVAGWLAWLNVAMAVFNLVPGYPLDGGRLLRALIWMGTGSRYRATRLAAGVGQVFAATLLVGALLSFLDPFDVPSPLRGAVGVIGRAVVRQPQPGAAALLAPGRVRLLSRISGLCLIGGGAWLALARSR